VFRKVLVANRGEIAVRVIRALREMGIASVAVYSDVDRASLHVRMADEAAFLGPAAPSESYLNVERILTAAGLHDCDAIHPGYGFLSENAAFARACEEGGVAFVGPSSKSIEQMGLKTEARYVAMNAGVPVVPGTESPIEDDVDAACEAAAAVGYPVMLKAAAGGGGKGMRHVASEAQMAGAFRDASSEAARSFGNGAMYIEKLIERPRHIEIQVLGDRFGRMVYLGERECSIQRRHQKVVEECPSPFVTENPELRLRMGQAAVRAARSAGYYNAGTVEFLVDQDANFYFLEMNTRLQVEHPVTELVTGLDLVQWQLRIAAGEELTVRQEDIAWRGAAIECRICAEDAARNFMPCPGRVTSVSTPGGPGIRIDSGIYPGWTVPVEYDPLLAKLAVWAGTRELAIERMRRALREYGIGGIETNIGFFEGLLDDAEFRAGRLHTGFIPEYLERAANPAPDAVLAQAAASAGLLRSMRTAAASPPVQATAGRWKSQGRSRELR